MLELIVLLFRAIALAGRGHEDIVLENLALRHQLRTLQRSVKRPHFHTRDRVFWVLLATAWRRWRAALVLVQPIRLSDGIETGSVADGLGARDTTVPVAPPLILSFAHSLPTWRPLTAMGRPAHPRRTPEAGD